MGLAAGLAAGGMGCLTYDDLRTRMNTGDSHASVATCIVSR
jgi:hypothetical protein